MGHPDRGDVEHGPEMEGEARSARMVTPRGVDQHKRRHRRKSLQRRSEKRAFAQGEEARVVGSPSNAGDDRNLGMVAALPHHGASPRRFPGAASPLATFLETDEAGSDGEVTLRRRPPIGRPVTNRGLRKDELSSRTGPVHRSSSVISQSAPGRSLSSGPLLRSLAFVRLSRMTAQAEAAGEADNPEQPQSLIPYRQTGCRIGSRGAVL